MVKNGRTKKCFECGIEPGMSHKFKGKYVCYDCSNITNDRAEEQVKDDLMTQVLHVFGAYNDDLYCKEGEIQDNNYIYRYKTSHWHGEPHDINWECLYSGRDETRVTCIYYCRKCDQRKLEFNTYYNGYDMGIIETNYWEADRLKLPLNAIPVRAGD